MGLDTRWRATVLCAMLAAATATLGNAQSLQLEQRSASAFVGKLAGTDVRFSVTTGAPDRFAIEIELGSQTRIEVEADRVTRSVVARSVTRSGAPAPITRRDRSDLRLLQKAVGVPDSEPGEILARTLLLLSVYPAGSVVDIDSGSVQGESANELSTKRIVSLCQQTGQQRTGSYDVAGIDYSETVQLGPCYYAKNDCLGRCGPGCSAPPISTIQVFAQDCLNHDLCTRKSGKIFGPCKDEWNSAADDFLFGRDCGLLRGQWIDNYSFTWLPRETAGSVLGKVETGTCRYSLSGVHNGAAVELVARTGNSLCCPSFTYDGRFRGCYRMSGTWTNTCGFSGSWVMTNLETLSSQQLSDILGSADLVPTDGPACRNP